MPSFRITYFSAFAHLSMHVSPYAGSTEYFAVDCSGQVLDAEPYFLNSREGKPIATRGVAALAWLRGVLT